MNWSVFTTKNLRINLHKTLYIGPNHTVCDIVLTRYKDDGGLLAITVYITTLDALTIEGGNFYDNDEVLVSDISPTAYISIYTIN